MRAPGCGGSGTAREKGPAFIWESAEPNSGLSQGDGVRASSRRGIASGASPQISSLFWTFVCGFLSCVCTSEFFLVSLIFISFR